MHDDGLAVRAQEVAENGLVRIRGDRKIATRLGQQNHVQIGLLQIERDVDVSALEMGAQRSRELVAASVRSPLKPGSNADLHGRRRTSSERYNDRRTSATAQATCAPSRITTGSATGLLFNDQP
jgi:hypothetical protein